MEKKDSGSKDKITDAGHEKLPVLPLPVLESNATRVILSYRHHLLQGVAAECTPSSDTGVSRTEDRDIKKQEMVLGLYSFDQTYNPKVTTRWRNLEEDAYECANVTPLPPFFQSHVPCLSSQTNNNSKPLCYMKGKFIYHGKNNKIVCMLFLVKETWKNVRIYSYFTKTIKHTFLRVYRHNKPRGMLGKPRKVCKPRIIGSGFTREENVSFLKKE